MKQIPYIVIALLTAGIVNAAIFDYDTFNRPDSPLLGISMGTGAPYLSFFGTPIYGIINNASNPYNGTLADAFLPYPGPPVFTFYSEAKLNIMTSAAISNSLAPMKSVLCALTCKPETATLWAGWWFTNTWQFNTFIACNDDIYRDIKIAFVMMGPACYYNIDGTLFDNGGQGYPILDETNPPTDVSHDGAGPPVTVNEIAICDGIDWNCAPPEPYYDYDTFTRADNDSIGHSEYLHAEYVQVGWGGGFEACYSRIVNESAVNYDEGEEILGYSFNESQGVLLDSFTATFKVKFSNFVISGWGDQLGLQVPSPVYCQFSVDNTSIWDEINHGELLFDTPLEVDTWYDVGFFVDGVNGKCFINFDGNILNGSSGSTGQINFWRIADWANLGSFQYIDDLAVCSGKNWACAPPTSCVENWTCSGYVACVKPAPTANCTAAIDQNECGTRYSGDYTEFTPKTCRYGGGGGWPQETQQPTEEEQAATMAVAGEAEPTGFWQKLLAWLRSLGINLGWSSPQ